MGTPIPILIYENMHKRTLKIYTPFKISHVKYLRKLRRKNKRLRKLEEDYWLRKFEGFVIHHIIIVSPFYLPLRKRPDYAEFGNKYFIMIQI